MPVCLPDRSGPRQRGRRSNSRSGLLDRGQRGASLAEYIILVGAVALFALVGYRLFGHEVGLAGDGIDAIAHPSWDVSSSLDPDAVQGVYFAAGWIPVLCEPLEANYLAVDLVALPGGRPGQVVLCGRDEDDKCVVAPNLATVLRALAAECRVGAWAIETAATPRVPESYLVREGGRLLSDCHQRKFPPRA